MKHAFGFKIEFIKVSFGSQNIIGKNTNKFLFFIFMDKRRNILSHQKEPGSSVKYTEDIQKGPKGKKQKKHNTYQPKTTLQDLIYIPTKIKESGLSAINKYT